MSFHCFQNLQYPDNWSWKVFGGFSLSSRNFHSHFKLLFSFLIRKVVNRIKFEFNSWVILTHKDGTLAGFALSHFALSSHCNKTFSEMITKFFFLVYYFYHFFYVSLLLMPRSPRLPCLKNFLNTWKRFSLNQIHTQGMS